MAPRIRCTEGRWKLCGGAGEAWGGDWVYKDGEWHRIHPATECGRHFWICGPLTTRKNKSQPGNGAKMCYPAQDLDVSLTSENIWGAFICPFCRVQRGEGKFLNDPSNLVGRFCGNVTVGEVCAHAAYKFPILTQERAGEGYSGKTVANLIDETPFVFTTIQDTRVTIPKSALCELVSFYTTAAALRGMVREHQLGIRHCISYPVIKAPQGAHGRITNMPRAPDGWRRPPPLEYRAPMQYQMARLGVRSGDQAIIMITPKDPAAWLMEFEREKEGTGNCVQTFGCRQLWCLGYGD